MNKDLCCVINPHMKCGFCNITWCKPCYDGLHDSKHWPQCSVPNNSGSDQGNHFTMDHCSGEMDDVDMDLSNVRRLVEGEKVTDFDGPNSVIG